MIKTGELEVAVFVYTCFIFEAYSRGVEKNVQRRATMESDSVRIGVVIATRNRPRELQKLLTSLCHSTVHPVEVSIVATGLDVEEVLMEFSDRLKFRYQWTQTGGQVAQKKLAIEMLDHNLDWCLFSDDDVIFDSHAIENALKTVKRSTGTQVIGVGFALTPTARVIHTAPWRRSIARLIGLDSSVPGRVLKSGHGVSYLESTKDIETEWLNGISMWRRDVAQNYLEVVPAIKPASCEDLFFSHSSRRFGKLLFASQARVHFQESEMTNSENLMVLNSAALWRLYLVKTIPNLSLVALLLSQLARVFYVLSQPKQQLSRPRIRYCLWFVSFVFFALKIGSTRDIDKGLGLIQERIADTS